MKYHHNHLTTYRQRGAALVVCLVLLTLLATFSGIVLRTILDDRRDTRKELVHNQIKILLQDGRDRAELLRQTQPEFTGETQEITTKNPSMSGIFRLTSVYNEERKTFDIDVVFLDKHGKTVIAQSL